MRTVTVRRHRRFVLTIFFILAFTLLVGASTAYGLVMKMSASQLTDTAATVIVAKATATHSRWTNPGGATFATKGTIVTDVRLSVYEVLKGHALANTTITVPGGSVGKVSIPIEDAPQFVAGQFYVIFLASSGQVVAWREGQPQVVGTQVPALHMSLSQLKSTVAARTGVKARELQPWSGAAPAEPVAPAEPAQVVSQSGAAAAAAPVAGGDATKTGFGHIALPPGTVLKPANPAPVVKSAGPRGVTTLLQDDFENLLTMDPWTLLYNTPPRVGEGYFSNDYWVDNQNYTYGWAYSAAQSCYMIISGLDFWDHQFAYGGSYGNNDSTYMYAGPYNLTNYSHAVLNFDLWLDTAGSNDRLYACFSTDGGASWYGEYWYDQEGGLSNGQLGGPPYFASKSVDLSDVGGVNYCGKSNVYVAFCFQSDSSGTAMGGVVDNVELDASNSPIPVISDVSPPSAPAGTYYEPSRNQSRITITGSGFGSSKGDVAFFYQDGEPLIAGVVRTWSNTSITCDVPIGIIDHYAASAGSGPLYVRTAGGVWSGGYSFDVPYSYGNENWEASLCMYRLNTNSMSGVSGAAGAIDSATNTWNNVGSGFLFQDVGTCTTMPKHVSGDYIMPHDGHNDMCFADASGYQGVIAFASPLEIGGRMLEVDIVFNTGGGFDWATNGDPYSMDVRTIATHETGHWLNLRDLYGPGNTNNVMYGFCDTGIIKQTLTQGERDGIDWIYADHSTDTAAPVGQAKSVKVTKGKTVKIQFEMNDPYPSCGVSTALVQIKKTASSSKVYKQTSTIVYTRFYYTWSFKCKLAKGKYKIVVTGTDALGHSSTQSKLGTLTVK